VNCDGELKPSEKEALKGWIEKEKDKDSGGGEKGLAERWGMSGGELKEFIQKVE